MKVIYFLGEFPLVTENFIIYEIDGMIRQGADVEVFSLSRPATGKTSEQPEKLGFADRIHYRSPLVKGKLSIQARVVFHLIKLFFSGNFKAIKKVLCDKNTSEEYSRYQLLATADALNKIAHDSNIIVSHFGPMGRFLAILKEYNLISTPFTTTFHGYDITSYVKKRGEEIYTLLFKNGAQFIFVSDFFRQKAIKMGAPEDKSMVCHTAINCQEFAFQPRSLPTEGPIRLICVGRMTEKKGHIYLLEAFAKLIQERPETEFHLDMVGGGPLKDDIKQVVVDFKIGDHVTLHGSVQHNTVRDLLKGAHIFVLHSVVAPDGDTEGIPGGIMEAMAQGLPVISTYHTGIPELVEHGVSGFLSQEKDVDELKTLILKLVDTPEIWPSLTKAARDKVENEFEREKETKRLLNALSKRF